MKTDDVNHNHILDFDVKNAAKFDYKKNFINLTARNSDNPSFELSEKVMEEYEKRKDE